MKRVKSMLNVWAFLSIVLFLSACQPIVAPMDSDSSEVDAGAAEISGAESGAVSAEEDKIANAMSGGPAAIAQDATILDYAEEWPGNWPDEPAPELIEIRTGTNGWTCAVDIPDTPGNDPMCLNETYLEVLLARYNLVDSPASGVGLGYMLQGGGPIGSPPHLMVFVPDSNESVATFGTQPGPLPWVMFPDTSHQHLMVVSR